MPKEVVRIEGLKEVQDALRSLLPDRTARGVMRRVLKQRGKRIAEAAAAKAPTGPAENLRESIQVSGTLIKTQRAGSRPNKDDVWVWVGPSSKHTKGIFAYAHLQEFGSSIHGAQPYIRPAWDNVRGTILNDIGKDMWLEIKKAVDRAAKKAAKIAGKG